MEPREFVNQELKIIEGIFFARKQINPMVILIKDDRRYPMPVNYQNTAHKEIVSQGIKDLVKRSEPDVVVYMAEAWTKFIRGNLDRLPTSILPTDLDKEEIIAVQIEFKSGEKFGAEARIIREGNRAYLEPFKVLDASLSMGRFVDFFPVRRIN
jgi:hypothetical protein